MFEQVFLVKGTKENNKTFEEENDNNDEKKYFHMSPINLKNMKTYGYMR